jgi:hypothetical protein
MNQNGLTKRQDALLDLLIYQHYLKKPLNRVEIQTLLSDYYPSSGGDNHYYDQAYNNITKDIQAINNSDAVDFVIISKPSGIKLADKIDVQDLVKERNSIIRKLVRVHKKLKKVEKNDALRFSLNLEEIELVKSLMGE